MGKTFIAQVFNDQPDSQNDIMLSGSLKIPDKVLVTKEFNHAAPICKANVFIDGNELKVKADLPEELDGYPAIGFQILESHVDENGVRVITEAKLHCVGISQSPNVDPLIKKISDQNPI